MSTDPITSSVRLRQLVELQGTAVTSRDIENYGQLQDIENRSRKLDAVLGAWTAQEDHYRQSRQRYANCLIGAFLVQGVVVNIAFFLIGTGVLHVEQWVSTTFVLGVFSEMAAISLIIFKYFFPSSPSKIIGLVDKL